MSATSSETSGSLVKCDCWSWKSVVVYWSRTRSNWLEVGHRWRGAQVWTQTRSWTICLFWWPWHPWVPTVTTVWGPKALNTFGLRLRKKCKFPATSALLFLYTCIIMCNITYYYISMCVCSRSCDVWYASVVNCVLLVLLAWVVMYCS